MRADDVRNTLYTALAEARKPCIRTSKAKDLVDLVLDGTHRTYKYILMTALASKATNASLNPLALQAGSSLPGAYDARSVCHAIITVFETAELGNALGGSNEPFLNKPARFPELKKTNAVRRGRDQQVLNALCDQLPVLATASDAFDALVYALQKLIVAKRSREELTSFEISLLDSQAMKLYTFIDLLLSASHEGEVLTLVIAGLYELYLSGVSSQYLVDVHPVNQSGASRKEISDLDIYENGALFITNELKDKPFTDHDLRHAADKVVASGLNQLHFIYGRHASCDWDETRGCVSTYLKNGFLLNVVSADEFILTVLSLVQNVDSDRYTKYILRTAIDTKFKESTIGFVRHTVKKHFGV